MNKSCRAAIFHNLPPGGARRAMVETLRAIGDRITWDVFQINLNPELPDFYNLRIGSVPTEMSLKELAENIWRYPDPRRPLPSVTFIDRIFKSRYASSARELIHFSDRKNYRALLERMAERIDSQGYDFINVRNCGISRVPPLIEFLHTPVIVTCEEPLRAAFEPGPEGDSWSRRKYLETLLGDHRKGLARAAAILGNSQYSCEYLRQAYYIEPTLLYYGVDTEVFNPVATQRENFVLSVGALVGSKGFEFVIESLATIEPESRPKFVIVGFRKNEEASQKLLAHGESFGVDVTIIDSCTDAELAMLYSKTQCTVFAPIREPFGLVVLESMACGTPVVGVAEGGLCETITHNKTGILTIRDHHAFGLAVRKLIMNPQLRNEMGLAGIEDVKERWTWGHTAERYMKIVDEVLSQT